MDAYSKTPPWKFNTQKLWLLLFLSNTFLNPQLKSSTLQILAFMFKQNQMYNFSSQGKKVHRTHSSSNCEWKPTRSKKYGINPQTHHVAASVIHSITFLCKMGTKLSLKKKFVQHRAVPLTQPITLEGSKRPFCSQWNLCLMENIFHLNSSL